MTGWRGSRLLELLNFVAFFPPKNVPMLRGDAGVMRKAHGFRNCTCGICSDERAVSVTDRAASRSKLFRRMFSGCMSSTSWIWRVLMLVLLPEGPEKLMRDVSWGVTESTRRD